MQRQADRPKKYKKTQELSTGEFFVTQLQPNRQAIRPDPVGSEENLSTKKIRRNNNKKKKK